MRRSSAKSQRQQYVKPPLGLERLEDRVTPTFDVTNLGLTTSSAFANGNLVAFQVAESAQGVDLNGDVDATDTVLHVYDGATAGTTNLGLAIPSTQFSVRGNLVAFLVAESAQGGVSLNGDGDATDNVLHVYDAAAGTINNLGLASTFFVVRGHLMAFWVAEFAQGGVSLNGDGDAIDNVFHVYDAATASTTNLGRAATGAFSIDGDLVVFGVDEFHQGGTDLNGDGRTTASGGVGHVYDAATATVTNLGLDSSGGIVVSGDRVVFTVREATQGFTDLNGDGDTSDFVVHVHDIATASTTNLGLATGGNLVDGNLVAIRVSETRQGGADLNGDGDATDLVLHVYDAATGATTNLGLESGSITSVSGNQVVFNVNEFRQGGADLNGDGDATATDLVLHVYDAATAVTTNFGLATLDFQHNGNLVAFRVWESEQGGTDFNGDGDVTDFVVHVYDAATATITNLGLGASSLPVVSGELMAFQVAESSQGNADFNGDGDTSDTVLHVYDAAAASTTNLGVAIQPFFIRLDGSLLAYTISESSQGGTDLNGDGDALDFVLNVADVVPNAPPVNTVPAAQEAAEDVALVFSSANGNGISISDTDAGSNEVQVTLSATNGTLSLGSTTGLTFSTGDGSVDASMTFTGSQADINAALNGLAFAPMHNFNGTAILSITTDDLGNSGSGGALSDTDSVSIAVLSVPEQIGNVTESVNDLVAASTLNWGQGNALTTKLNHALDQFQRGQFQTAVNLLNAFINQVQAFIAEGILGAANGNGLIAAVNNIIAGILT